MRDYILNKPQYVTPSQTKRYGQVKIAQDVHAHFHVASFQEEGQVPKALRKRDPETHLGWMAQIAAQSKEVYSCYEAGPTGFHLHRELTKLGIKNFVVAPIRLDEHGKRVVNDKTDTMSLAGRLDRYVAGNTKMFTVVRVPTIEEEQRRAKTRQIKQLQQTRLKMASQGRTFALTQGQNIQNSWWLAKHWEVFKKKLPAWMIERLEIFHRLIVAVNQELEKLEQQIVDERRAQKIIQPRYAGDKTMEIIEAEVCDWTRFTSCRRVGSYTGLVGGVNSSGEYQSDLSITKAGNKRLRAALVEMAWRFVRHQPEYWLTKKWNHILGPERKAHRRQRKRAIVAYARQLMVDLWKWKTGRITPEKLGWVMT